MKRNLKPHGITLIELLVAIAIVGILSIASIPLFTPMIQKHRLIGQAETLFQALQFARTEAIKRHLPVVVSFVVGDNWCYGINTSAACNCLTPSSCNLGVTAAPAAQQNTLSITGLAGGSVTFEPTHAAADASGTVTFTVFNDTRLISINISRLGNLQMCSTDISGYTSC